MTELVDLAVTAMKTLPDDAQDEIARLVLSLAGGDIPAVELTPDEEAALDRSEAAAARGDFASEERIKAIWAKHGL